MFVLILSFFRVIFDGILRRVSKSRGLDYVGTEAVVRSEQGNRRNPTRSIVITIPEASVAAYMEFLRQLVPEPDVLEVPEPADTE